METHWQKMHCAIHFISWKDFYTKAKTLNALRQKHQVVHDHYLFWKLKTTGSSMEVQLFRVCPRGNGGSLVSFASWSSTSTISMLRLPKVSAMSAITFFSSSWIMSGLIKPAERYDHFCSISFFPEKTSDPLLSLCRENWLSSYVFFPRGISASPICRACIPTRIYPFFGLLRSASTCLVTVSPTIFQLGLPYRVPALCPDE